MPVELLLAGLIDAGLSQQEIAAEIQCSQGHISRLLNRKRKRPNAELYLALVDLRNRRAVAKKARARSRPKTGRYG